MSPQRLHVELLANAGRLLLEYNESTGAIQRALAATARALGGEECRAAVSYNGVAVSFAGQAPVLEPVRELRYNTAVQREVHAVLERVRRGELEPAAALVRLRTVEADTGRHSRGLVVLLVAAGAAALARLLGADVGTLWTVAVSTGLGLVARQELGRRHFSVFTLPLTAAMIGAVLGALAIRMGWARSAELALVVPSLMLVPGPHLINGLLDLLDNHLPMSLARLGLAAGILIAATLGVIIGIELTLPLRVAAGSGTMAAPLNLATDMLLAAIVTCGFAVFYNTRWPLIGLAMVGGAAGHGLRFLALQADWRLETATLLGGLAVGGVSAWMARIYKAPVAVIAFAGAVTMIPGLQMYRALGGALRCARVGGAAEPSVVAGAAGNALQACLVVGGLALGLVLGTRVLAAGRD